MFIVHARSLGYMNSNSMSRVRSSVFTNLQTPMPNNWVCCSLVEFNEGGSLNVRALEEAAQRACDMPVVRAALGPQGAAAPPASQPFLCLDLTYIAALLTDGYRFDRETRFVVRSFHELSLCWLHLTQHFMGLFQHNIPVYCSYVQYYYCTLTI